MEVTRDNFAKLLPSIEESINNALFLSIDAEFTGLRTGLGTSSIDTPAECYSKLRSGSVDFLLIQFGLAIFNYDQVMNEYTYKAYSFYLFPKPSNLGKIVPDSIFKSQASSLHMLATSKFDFNKAFHQGITFLNHVQRESVIDKLEEKRRLRTLESKFEYDVPLPVPEEYKPTVQMACDAVQELLGNKTLHKITLPRCSNFVRKLIYQALRNKFGREELSFEIEYMNIIVRKRLNMEDRIEEEKRLVQQEGALLREAIGFTRVIEIISKSRKPVVGHNMMLDLCHIIKRFWQPLPEDYEDFKALVHHVFPKILDTKHLSTLKVFRGKLHSSSLPDLYRTIQQPPFQIIKSTTVSDKGYNLTIWKPHNAGFDAFITGVIYQTLVNYIGSVQTPPVNPVFPNHSLLANVNNIVYLMRIDSYMNLEGPEPLVSRDHVFYLTCPKEWKNFNVMQLFRPYGGVHIHWINDWSAFITLHSKNQASIVTKILVVGRKGINFYNSVYKLIPYEEYVNESGTKRPKIFKQKVFKSSKVQEQMNTMRRGSEKPISTPTEKAYYTDPVVRRRGCSPLRTMTMSLKSTSG